MCYSDTLVRRVCLKKETEPMWEKRREPDQ